MSAAAGARRTAKKPPTFIDKLVTKLRKIGFTERKAKVVAKALAPVCRSGVKSELVAKDKLTTRTVQGEVLEDSAALTLTDKEKTSGKIKVNGHFLRLDLPTVPMQGAKGLDVLRVMHGLSSSNTYLVAAVKGAEGIVAVRDLGEVYNVKFYPDMAFWGKDQTALASLGAIAHLKREWYERMHFSRVALDQLMRRLEAEAKPKSRTKTLLDRFFAISTTPLVKAFGFLSKRRQIAA